MNGTSQEQGAMPEFLGSLLSGAYYRQGALHGLELRLRRDILCLGHSLLEPPPPTVASTLRVSLDIFKALYTLPAALSPFIWVRWFVAEPPFSGERMIDAKKKKRGKC